MYQSIEMRRACCALRKLEPLARMLAGRSAWITGLRRGQSGERASVPFETGDAEGRTKFNPLADWSWADIWHHIAVQGVPYNPLHDAFFPSIGCAPCRRRTAAHALVPRRQRAHERGRRGADTSRRRARARDGVRRAGAVVASAQAGQSAGVVLHRPVDVSRGDWLGAPGSRVPVRRFAATLAWFDTEAAVTGRRYWVRHGHRRVHDGISRIGTPRARAGVMAGRVVFGAGPGASDLITLRGMHWLREAEVVVHDAHTDPGLRERAPRARWIDVGKRGFRDSTGQASIHAMLVGQARRGRVVVRLKGGDPSIFGRLEIQALAAASIACEVVPGVTAALAAAADSSAPSRAECRAAAWRWPPR